MKAAVASIGDLQPRYLRGSNLEYTRFILVGHQRSGSSLIINTLRKHPEVLAFGEIMYSERTDFNIEGYENESEETRRFRDSYPIGFLDNFIFRSYCDSIGTVGFKMFPDQLDTPRFRCVWKWLDENPDIKIINLNRQNLLSAYVSLLIAEKDQKFSIRDKSERSSTRIFIDPEDCASEFNRRMNYNRMARQRIRNHDVLEIDYGRLAFDPVLHLREIQNFVGAPVRELGIATIKQELRPLSEIIENYEELRCHFFATQWESFFEPI